MLLSLWSSSFSISLTLSQLDSFKTMNESGTCRLHWASLSLLLLSWRKTKETLTLKGFLKLEESVRARGMDQRLQNFMIEVYKNVASKLEVKLQAKLA